MTERFVCIGSAENVFMFDDTDELGAPITYEDGKKLVGVRSDKMILDEDPIEDYHAITKKWANANFLTEAQADLLYADIAHNHLSLSEGSKKVYEVTGDVESYTLTVKLGDVEDGGNSSKLTIDDANEKITSSVLLSAPTLESSVTTGTAPLAVTSTTVVSNLNADLLDGNHASAFAASAHNHNINSLQRTWRLLEVDKTGNDTTAAAGAGPFLTITAAVNYAMGSISPIASSTNPVVILVHTGIYDEYTITMYDGISIVGESRTGVVIKDTQFASNNVGTVNWELNNFTLLASTTATTINGQALATSTVAISNVDMISTLPFDEIIYNGMVAQVQIMAAGAGTSNIVFDNCTYSGKSMFAFIGHPSSAYRTPTVNMTLRNCYIAGITDSGDGPADPHFLINWYTPGTLNIYNSYLSWDMSASTSEDQDCGVIFMDNEDGNGYAGNQYLNLWNSRLAMVHNGGATATIDPTILAVLGKTSTNRFTGRIEDCTFLKGAYVVNDIFTNNNHTIYYGGSNISTIVSGGGSPVITRLTEGMKTFDSATVNGLITANKFTINDAGADLDCRIEGDNDANLFYTDASTDRVGIGISTPATKLDVNGSFGAKQFVINEAGEDLDSRIEGDTDANLFTLDAGLDAVGFGASTPTGKVEIQTTSTYAKPALVLDQDDVDQDGLLVEYPTSGASGYPLAFSLTKSDSGDNPVGNYTELNGASEQGAVPMINISDYSGWNWKGMMKVKLVTGVGTEEVWMPVYTWTPVEK